MKIHFTEMWAKNKEKMRNSLSSWFLVIDPEQKEYTTNRLQDFCNERNLAYTSLWKTCKTGKHRKEENLKDGYVEQLEKTISKRISKLNTAQQAAKIMLNSLFGSCGNQFFRFYDLRQAEAITITGQFIIQKIQKSLNDFLNKTLNTNNVDYCIASDTDSIFLDLGELVNKFCKASTTSSKIEWLDKISKELISPFIKKEIGKITQLLNAKTESIEMVRDVIADRGLWTAKKRYCLNVYDSEGIRYTDPKLKIMGIEVQRSSTPRIVRDKLKESIKIILTKTEEDLVKFTEDFKQEFKSCSPEQIAFPRGVNGIKEYSDPNTIYQKGTPIHTKGALLYNHMIKQLGLTKKYTLIGDGEKIKFLYLKCPNPTQEKVISFPVNLPPEFDLHKYVDYNLQFEKVFLDPLDNIVKAIGWSFEPKNTLESMFG